jgi:hypothetical protein
MLFFSILKVCWVLVVMVVVVDHVLYCFNTTECLKATCWLMLIVPWCLLYITNPFLFWVELLLIISYWMLWHTTHFIHWDLEPSTIIVWSLTKTCQRTYCFIPSKTKNLVALQFHKQLFITCLFFNL